GQKEAHVESARLHRRRDPVRPGRKRVRIHLHARLLPELARARLRRRFARIELAAREHEARGHEARLLVAPQKQHLERLPNQDHGGGRNRHSPGHGRHTRLRSDSARSGWGISTAFQVRMSTHTTVMRASAASSPSLRPRYRKVAELLPTRSTATSISNTSPNLSVRKKSVSTCTVGKPSRSTSSTFW